MDSTKSLSVFLNLFQEPNAVSEAFAVAPITPSTLPKEIKYFEMASVIINLSSYALKCINHFIALYLSIDAKLF
jgi:hypothetical protein